MRRGRRIAEHSRVGSDKFRKRATALLARLGLTALTAGAVLRAPSALAHDGSPPAPHDLATAWSTEPGILVPLVAALVLYVAGVSRAWRRARRGRGVSAGHATAFLGGWLALFAALVSPLDALSAALFSAHMVQHLLLILVAAPLLVLARPMAALAWGLPRGPRIALARTWLRHPNLRRPVSWLVLPLTAWTVHVAMVAAWHVPALYDWALANDAAHAVEHAAFLGSALLFWWALVQGRGRALSYGASVLYVFAMALVSTLLGALITFAPTPWYRAYATSTAAWGLTPLADQQLAGAIMWVPAGIIYAGTMIALVAAWLRAVEKRVAARETDEALAGRTPPSALVREGKTAP